jgi:hypothetical protein
MIFRSEPNSLMHFGILRRSGRYPWGSGEDVETRSRDFIGTINDLKKQGLSETDIARAFHSPEHPFTTTDLRAATTIARNAVKQSDINMARKLQEKGMSNVAIGKQMGRNESSVRQLLAPGEKDKADILQTTADMLERQIAEKSYIDVGTGVENHLGIARTKLNTAVSMLIEKGYTRHYIKTPQLGTGLQTTQIVLAKPDVPYSEVYKNRGEIKQIVDYSDDGGRSFLGIKPPLNVDSKRIAVRYKEEGGDKADGVIYVRPGVEDLSLGGKRYAQVRISVDGTHYLKGMAMYKEDLPAGVDLMFNTNKSNTGNKLDAMKPLKDDPDNPFGAVIRQIGERDVSGNLKQVTSAMNLVNEEGDWGSWSKSLSTQFLSKQSPKLAKDQLDMTYERRKNELAEIRDLTNPSVRKKLLEAYSDSVDSAVVHLKAAHLPRQGSHVILPIDSMKENEVYAPNFRNGEQVVLIRYPHGGIFEIPELTVNNRHPEAKRLLGDAEDAIGINSKVAEKLSGADFDGDTVLVIPNNQGKIKTAKSLEKLKDFDPKASYPPYDGMRTIDGGVYDAKTNKVDYGGRQPSSRGKGTQMGLVSNLITDMTIKGASADELARAVRHSMVVIDAEKHHLDWKESAKANGISSLMEKYQGSKQGGSSTLISRARSPIRVEKKAPRSAKDGGPIDRETGKLVFTPTGESYKDPVSGKTIIRTQRSSKLAETDNAHTLVSEGGGTTIERLYADHSNRLKALANEARKEMVNTKGLDYSPSANKAYAPEVQRLRAALDIAERNAPLERQAQVLANAWVRQKRDANPDMDKVQLKKVQFQALEEARKRTGAGKKRIEISDREWDAIQAGAISKTMLNDILTNANLDRVKQLATPKSKAIMTSTKKQRALNMKAAGFTQSEIADQLGVSLTTLKNSLEGE